MTDARAIRDEVDAAVHAWRAEATDVVLIVAALAGLPAVVLGVFANWFVLPALVPWVALPIYGLVLAALCIPRRYYRWRAVTLLFSLYALAVAQLAFNGLVGGGRTALLVLPLLTLILMGSKAGWIAASVTGLLLIVFTVLIGADWLAVRDEVRANSLHPGYWLLQVVLLLAALIPLMILFTRFMALQMRTMLGERQARRDLESEVSARFRLEGEIMRISEEERRRLGSELHDGLCQHLTAALLHCTAVENQLAAVRMQQAGSAGRLRSMIEESIGMAYDVSKGLCPLDLTPEALVSALQRLARQTRETAGLACHVRHEGEVANLDQQKALHLFRIAQEAVTNAVKHAHCSAIQIEILSSAESYTLRIRDDGVGLYADANAEIGGMGLRLMAHRAGVIGGTLVFERPSTGGTVVSCSVPTGPPRSPLP